MSRFLCRCPGWGVRGGRRDLGVNGVMVSGCRILYGRRGTSGRLHGAGDARCDSGTRAVWASAEGSHACSRARVGEDNGNDLSGAQGGGRGSQKPPEGSTDLRGVRGTGANRSDLHSRRKPAGRGPACAGGGVGCLYDVRGRSLHCAPPSRVPNRGGAWTLAPPCLLLPAGPKGWTCTKVKVMEGAAQVPQVRLAPPPRAPCSFP